MPDPVQRYVGAAPPRHDADRQAPLEDPLSNIRFPDLARSRTVSARGSLSRAAPCPTPLVNSWPPGIAVSRVVHAVLPKAENFIVLLHHAYQGEAPAAV